MSRRWPWAKISPSEFFTRCAMLSATERGILISLELRMFDEGGAIDNDARSLARLCGADKRTIGLIIPALVRAGLIREIGGRLISETVTRQLADRQEVSDLRSKNARDRWKKPSENNDAQMQEHTEVRVRDIGEPSAPPTGSAPGQTEVGSALERAPSRPVQGASKATSSVIGNDVVLPEIGLCEIEGASADGWLRVRSHETGEMYDAFFQNGRCQRTENVSEEADDAASSDHLELANVG